MKRQSVRVEVDVHEPVALRDELRRLGAEVAIAPLPIGDYRTGDRLVERKTVHDLHASLTAGRLWGQLGRLRAAAAVPILLIEGAVLDGAVSPAAIRGALLAAMENGALVIRSQGTGDSALWIHRIACRAGRSRRAPQRPFYAQRPKQVRPDVAAEAALAAIPGVSVVSARALLERFGSLEAIVRATDVELKDVGGIGPTRAQAIRTVLTHLHCAYRSRQSRERSGRAT